MLEKIVKGVISIGFVLFGIRMFDVDAIPKITPHIGNFPFAFLPVYLSGFIGEDLQKSKSMYVRDLGKCLPGLSFLATSTYLSLGELYNIVPKNKMDEQDIPAVFAGAVCGYILAKSYQIKERRKRRRLLEQQFRPYISVNWSKY
ncbi:hypothetical protein HY837_03750 [archaeon]|nr:hypothetical protein [archaeon]